MEAADGLTEAAADEDLAAADDSYAWEGAALGCTRADAGGVPCGGALVLCSEFFPLFFFVPTSCQPSSSDSPRRSNRPILDIYQKCDWLLRDTSRRWNGRSNTCGGQERTEGDQESTVARPAGLCSAVSVGSCEHMHRRASCAVEVLVVNITGCRSGCFECAAKYICDRFVLGHGHLMQVSASGHAHR